MKRKTIAACITAAFITTFIGSGLNLAIPDMAQEFDTGSAQAGWIVSVYMITCASLAVPFGKVADTVGKRRILIGGILIFALSSLAAVFSVGLWMLLMCRFLQAIGASMIFSTNVALILTTAEEEHRGKIMGYITGATYGGLALGPVICGLLNGNWGWKSIFIVSFLVASAAAIMAFSLPKEDGRVHRINGLTGRTIPILLLYTGSMALLLLGLSGIAMNHYSWLICLTGLTGGIIFIRLERKNQFIFSEKKQILSSKVYLYANLATLINAASVYSITYFLSIYFQTAKEFSSQKAGLILMAAPIVQTILSICAGRLADRISPAKLSATGLLLCACSLGSFLLLKEDTELIRIILGLALAGGGTGLFASPNGKIIMGQVEKTGHGAASAVLATMRSIGHTVSMAVASFAGMLYMGNASLSVAGTADIIKAGQVSFSVFAILCIIGIFLALRKKV